MTGNVEGFFIFSNDPGLEALKRERKGQHSIRINDQWRICFRWKDGDAYDAEITDYHFSGVILISSTRYILL